MLSLIYFTTYLFFIKLLSKSFKFLDILHFFTSGFVTAWADLIVSFVQHFVWYDPLCQTIQHYPYNPGLHQNATLQTLGIVRLSRTVNICFLGTCTIQIRGGFRQKRFWVTWTKRNLMSWEVKCTKINIFFI